MNNLPILLLFLSIIVTTFNRGFFSFPAITIVGSIFIILFYLFIKNVKIVFKRTDILHWQFLFVAVFSLFLFFSGGIYQTENFASILLYFLPILSFPIVLTYILEPKSFPLLTLKTRFYFLFGLAILLRILIIIASPSPIIDVFTILKEAPLVFLTGGNPYDHIYSPVYSGVITDYFPYFPVAFLSQVPFAALFGDPRILFIISDILAAVGLFLLGKKTFIAQILVLIYLFRPNSNFILEQSWVTPLSYLLLILTIFALQTKKQFLLGIITGVMTALQPLYAILVPFFLNFVANWKKTLFSFFLAFIFLVMPFFLKNPFKFLDKTIFVYFKPENLIPTIPIHLSLNISTAFYTLAGFDIPQFASLILISILLIFILYRLYIKRKAKDIRYILLGLNLFFYGFFLLFRQAFINYYYFAGSLIILWLIVVANPNKK